LTRSTRILLLTQWFEPEPALKGLSFARGLRERGFEVEVLTGFPNFPTGTLYDGYTLKFHERTVVEGIPVHRAYLYPSHDRSPVRRSLNYLSFGAFATIVGMLKLTRPDVIYAYHPPASVGWAGALLARFFDAPLVLDVQDLWPDTVASSGMMSGGVMMSILGAACRLEYESADHIVALSAGMAALLADRGADPRRTSVIHNWAVESRLDAAPDAKNQRAASDSLSGRFSVLFAGQMGEAQGLDVVLDAAELSPSITWVFLGGGSARGRLEQSARDRKLANVRFVDRVPMESVGAWLAAAGALLVNLSADPLYAASIPSKLQAYLRAGRPVLIAARGDAADMVLAARAGVACPPGDPRALADAAERLASMTPAERATLSANGTKYYMDHLSFAVGADKFAALFRDLAAGRAA
jgi:colanic acid biosynthesis glycosyl transferase WcaI